MTPTVDVLTQLRREWRQLGHSREARTALNAFADRHLHLDMGGCEDLAEVEGDRPDRPVEVDLQIEQQARDVDLDRANLAARAAQRRGKRQMARRAAEQARAYD